MEFDKVMEAFRRLARAGIPFDPVAGLDFKGANVTRLQRAMQDHSWKDPRFVTTEEAKARGWNIPPGAAGVEAVLRDASTGQSNTITLYNASNVVGMPGLQEMLEYGAEELQALMGKARAAVVEAAPAQEEEGEDLVIGPAPLALQRDAKAEVAAVAAQPEQVLAQQQQPTQAPTTAKAVPGQLSGDLGAYAPYFQDGLHNFEGIEMVKQINRLIADQELARNRKGIELLLSSFPNARRLGVEIAPMEKLRDDTLWKLNPSEPAKLLDGQLARDKEGAYRPSAGGLAVLKDSGTSLVLKSKSEQAYRGAMELAKSKGWAAIELKGKPKMLAQAWIEAKLMGLEVVNYKPTEKDREVLAARIAEEQARQKEQEAKVAQGATESPEIVEVLPVSNGKGQTVNATVTHTVAVPAPSAAEPGASLATEVPVVARSVTRVGDVVREDVHEALVPVQGDALAQVAADPDAAHEVGETAAQQQVTQAAEALQREADRSLESVVLVSHGPAPYDNNPKNKASYFVTVRDAGGAEQTIWGVDLPRSLGEASAAVGDTITLTERGRQPVTVEGELPGGGVGAKSAHRVRWETAVVAKALVQDAKVDLVNSGLHLGPIMKIEGGLIGQKNSRDPGRLAWHDATKLDGPVPAVGEWAEIAYKNGRGAVMVRGLEQAKAVER